MTAGTAARRGTSITAACRGISIAAARRGISITAAVLAAALVLTISVLGATVPGAGQAAAVPQPGWLQPHLAPGTSGLTAELAVAYTLARQEAARSGVTLSITSGKRSRAEQEALWRDGVATYGSPGAARRWVLPPGESTHVTGEAIDVGPRSGAQWLDRHGYRWGLCRTFDNEWWHFEFVTVPSQPCPPRLPDASRR